MNQLEPACLVIADITGYTSYLAGVELDHAQDILADLMDTVVGGLRPQLRLAKLEGDAAFAYRPGAEVDGSALQDTIERTYFRFRRRLRDIGQATRCECNACILIPRLDLKFVVHHGTVVRHRVAGREELVGADVIIVHRLLKNDVAAATGLGPYAMYTDAAVAAARIDAPAQLLRRHVEATDVAGDVGVWLRDLDAAWLAEQSRARVFIDDDGALDRLEIDYPGPPEVVWEWLTSPARRPAWQYQVTDVQESAVAGRRGPGTVNHCVHGRDAVVEEILDWQPFDYLTIRLQLPIPGTPKVVITDALEATPGGTRRISRLARPRSAKERRLVEGLGGLFRDSTLAGAEALRPLIAEDVARRRAESSGEPDLLPAAARHLTAPIRLGVDSAPS